jgi:hypothetical protein
MPFRTVLCLVGSAGLLVAVGQNSSAVAENNQQPPAVTKKNDFVNPNLAGLLQPPDAHSKSWNNGLMNLEPKLLAPNQPAKLESGTKECSIPLKWARIQKSAPDRQGEKWIGPHPERMDPIYGRTPAPVCEPQKTNPLANPTSR